jgi:lipid II:glycine glycyltransferase (peptidoglycan interpeptide bridge formation enzyme)
MSNKELYQQFCEQEKEIPVFVRPWYLDAVCQAENESWDVLLVKKNEKIIASWPYSLKRKNGFEYSVLPKLTKFLGPYFIAEKRSPKDVHKICETLIQQLPKPALFLQNFHYNFIDWLPFYWAGFEQSTRYSYVLEDLHDLDQVYNNFSSDYRNNKIRKAQQTIKVVSDLSLEAFFEVAMMSFKRQNIAIPFSLDFFKKYDAAMVVHHARQLFFAVDDQNRIHSVVYLLVDHDRAYYHLAGDNPDLRGSGASVLLVWEAIKYTHTKLGLNIFDFEGSMIKPIERVRRQFGAVQKSYFEIKKYNSKIFKTLEWIKKQI